MLAARSSVFRRLFARRTRAAEASARGWSGCAVALCAALSVAIPIMDARAQALNYPAMQIPSVSYRDFTASLVGSNGTMIMGQWREAISPRMHIGFDGGLYDPSSSGNRTAIFGASALGYDLMRAQSDQPLDLLLTAGVGVSLANSRTSLRLPVGVSMGHRFELEDGMAITPFVHPRLSIDFCSSCSGRGRSQSDVSLNFDIGGSFELSERLSVRAAVLFSGAEQYGSDDAIAVGLTWTPAGLRRP